MSKAATTELWLCIFSRAGRAAHGIGDVKRAKAEYRLAIVADSSNMQAWEGMAELQMGNGEVAEAQQTFEQLVRQFFATAPVYSSYTLQRVLASSLRQLMTC